MAEPIGPKESLSHKISRALLSFLEDASILATLRLLLPGMFKWLGGVLGDHLEKKVENDKRAEMMREFRRMDDNEIDISKIEARYEQAIAEKREPRFVELISKLCPEDPNDPLSIRPTVVTGENGKPEKGKPQNDRQADLMWLNKMDDRRFGLWMEFLDHNVLLWWGIRLRDYVVRVSQRIWGDLKVAFLAMCVFLGPLGAGLLFIARPIYRVVRAIVRWIFGTFLGMFLGSIVLVTIVGIVLLIAIFSDEKVRRFFKELLGLNLFLLALWGVYHYYHRYVPDTLANNLIAVIVMAFVVYKCLKLFPWVRLSMAVIIVGACLIAFLLSKDSIILAAQAKIAQWQQENARDREIAAQKAVRTVVVQQTPAEPSTPEASSELRQNVALLTPPAQQSLPLCLEYKIGADQPTVPTYTFGDNNDFVIKMLTCHPEGNRVLFSGNITYTGTDKKFILWFHPFTVHDSTGMRYDIQEGLLDGGKGMGGPYAGMRMPPGTTVRFSFAVESHDGSPVSAPYISVVMPCPPEVGRQINFQNLILN